MTLQTEITQETINTICQGVVVKDSWGQYVPQRLAEIILNDWPEALKAAQEQCPKDTLDILLEGPGHDDYAEAFDEILEIKITMDTQTRTKNNDKNHHQQSRTLVSLSFGRSSRYPRKSVRLFRRGHIRRFHSLSRPLVPYELFYAVWIS